MMGRPGSGRARNASISFPRSATTIGPLWSCFRHSGTRIFAWTRKSGVYSARFRGALRVPGMTGDLRTGDEERRQPGLDIFRDFPGGAILGVAEGAGAGETLDGAGDVIGHAGERGAGHDRFVRSDFDQIVLRIDAVVLAGGQRGGRI